MCGQRVERCYNDYNSMREAQCCIAIRTLPSRGFHPQLTTEQIPTPRSRKKRYCAKGVAHRHHKAQKAKIMMNTAHFPTFAGSARSVAEARDDHLYRAQRARLAQAAHRVRPYLARLPDKTLQILGFSAIEIMAIRDDVALS